MDKKLDQLLRKVPEAYDDFVLGMKLYVRNDEEAKAKLIAFLEVHPEASTDEVDDHAWEIGDQSSDDCEYEDD